MKTIRSIGFASIAGAALAILSPLSIADANQDQANSGNTVHRVSHALAANQKYTGGTNSGYKWGQKSRAVESKATWSEASETRSGYKWGQSSAPSAAQPGVAGFAEQSANRWKRRSSTEQAANRWKRRSFAEQSANRWKRR